MIIKFKKTHLDAVMPKQAHSTDAGYDMVAIDDGIWEENGLYIEYDTGIAIQPPEGYHTKISARSSVSKYDLVLCNGEGLIDVSYTGSIRFRFKPMGGFKSKDFVNSNIICSGIVFPKAYKKGDKIGQLKIEKTIYADFEEVEELDYTTRGDGGFGSTK